MNWVGELVFQAIFEIITHPLQKACEARFGKPKRGVDPDSRSRHKRIRRPKRTKKVGK